MGGTEHRGHGGAALDGGSQNADIGEAGPLDDGQAGSHRTDSDSLDQGGDARGEQGNLHQYRDVLRPSRQGDKKRYGDVAREHREHMLDAERHRFRHRRAIVRGLAACFRLPWLSSSF